MTQESKDQNLEDVQSEQAKDTANQNEPQDTAQDEKDILKAEVGELKDKYLRLYSEFDNFRRRTSKEKVDFFKTANEDLMSTLIPVLDDFERAHKSMTDSKINEAVAEGITLIYHKLTKTLESKGLRPMEAQLGLPFNSELHEAITQSPAPSEDLKGKIIDVLEKGYYLNDKVIRFAKVIIGS